MKVFDVQGEMFEAGKDIPVWPSDVSRDSYAKLHRHTISSSTPPRPSISQTQRPPKRSSTCESTTGATSLSCTRDWMPGMIPSCKRQETQSVTRIWRALVSTRKQHTDLVTTSLSIASCRHPKLRKSYTMRL